MRPTVIKIGGGLLGIPGALEQVCAAVGAVARREPVLVVPGGGPLADAVRELDGRLRLSAHTAHWMAILAMDQYAHVLAERIAGARLVEESGAIAGALAAGQVAVLAPSRWFRAADPLPHSWDATSDSVAAFVAGALPFPGICGVVERVLDAADGWTADPATVADVLAAEEWARARAREIAERPGVTT
jgi:aspartokinase-like uncharacterized kinase